MVGFKRTPVKKLEKEYQRKLLQIRDTQRAGDIQALALLTEESQKLLKRMESLRAGASGPNE